MLYFYPEKKPLPKNNRSTHSGPCFLGLSLLVKIQYIAIQDGVVLPRKEDCRSLGNKTVKHILRYFKRRIFAISLVDITDGNDAIAFKDIKHTAGEFVEMRIIIAVPCQFHNFPNAFYGFVGFY